MSTAVAVASVVSLWRYPVKSMMGEELNASVVTERGLLGDRAFAVVDSSTGKVASAKNRGSRRSCSTSGRFAAPPIDVGGFPVRITLPDGTASRASRAISARRSATARPAVVFATSAPDAPSLDEYWPDPKASEERTEGSSGTFFD